MVDEATLKSALGSSAFVVRVNMSEKSPKETACQREHHVGQQINRGGVAENIGRKKLWPCLFKDISAFLRVSENILCRNILRYVTVQGR